MSLLGRLIIVLGFWIGCLNSSIADEVIWSNEVRRVDPSKQTYERLPAKPPTVLPDATPAGSFRIRGFVRIKDSTSFVYKKKTYTLSRADPIPNSKICFEKDGGRWNCGLKARTVFQQYLSAKDVLCVPVTTTDTSISVTCGSEELDVATKLIELGFAVER